MPSTRIIEGPSSRTTLVGPDGSVIDSVSPGGRVIADSPAIVAEAAPVVAAAYSAPLIKSAPIVSAYSTPIVSSYSAPLVSAYSAPVVSAYSAPVLSTYSSPLLASGVVAQKSLDTLVAGPSGTIATSKTLTAPTVVAAAPSLYAAHGLYL